MDINLDSDQSNVDVIDVQLLSNFIDKSTGSGGRNIWRRWRWSKQGDFSKKNGVNKESKEEEEGDI
jgi:hypothetical protein